MIKTVTTLLLLTTCSYSMDMDMDVENYNNDKLRYSIHLHKQIELMEKDVDQKYYQMFLDVINMFTDVNTIETVRNEMLSHYCKLRDEEIKLQKQIMNPTGLTLPEKLIRKVRFS